MLDSRLRDRLKLVNKPGVGESGSRPRPVLVGEKFMVGREFIRADFLVIPVDRQTCRRAEKSASPVRKTLPRGSNKFSPYQHRGPKSGAGRPTTSPATPALLVYISWLT